MIPNDSTVQDTEGKSSFLLDLHFPHMNQEGCDCVPRLWLLSSMVLLTLGSGELRQKLGHTLSETSMPHLASFWATRDYNLLGRLIWELTVSYN